MYDRMVPIVYPVVTASPELSPDGTNNTLPSALSVATIATNAAVVGYHAVYSYVESTKNRTSHNTPPTSITSVTIPITSRL